MYGQPIVPAETLYRRNCSSQRGLHDEMGPSIQFQYHMIVYEETMKNIQNKKDGVLMKQIDTFIITIKNTITTKLNLLTGLEENK